MKKTILAIVLALISIICLGQNNGALKFLGIPIDGTKEQFTTQLAGKGFVYSYARESYRGEFNGKEVDVYIHTNHNLVDRVYVAFPYTSERNIKIDFNILLNQFKRNPKYVDLNMNSEIPEEDDISYEITVHEKRYQASFSYFDPDRDQKEMIYSILDKCSNFFTEEQLISLKEDISKYMELSDSEQNEITKKMAEMVSTNTEQSEDSTEQAFRFIIAYMDAMESLADGSVWFMIHEGYGQYQIGLYYDNLHNQAHGEDL